MYGGYTSSTLELFAADTTTQTRGMHFGRGHDNHKSSGVSGERKRNRRRATRECVPQRNSGRIITALMLPLNSSD